MQLQKTKGGLKKKGGPKAAARRKPSGGAPAEPTASHDDDLLRGSCDAPRLAEPSEEKAEPSVGDAGGGTAVMKDAPAKPSEEQAELLVGDAGGGTAATEDESIIDDLLNAEFRRDRIDCSTWGGLPWEGWQQLGRIGSIMGPARPCRSASGRMGRASGIWPVGRLFSMSAIAPLLPILQGRTTRYGVFCARPVSCAVHRGGSPFVGRGFRFVCSFALAVRGCQLCFA